MAGSNQNKSIVLRGAVEICGAVGVPIKQIIQYVKKHGLPAFKVGGKEWLEITADLEKWIIAQSKNRLSG